MDDKIIIARHPSIQRSNNPTSRGQWIEFHPNLDLLGFLQGFCSRSRAQKHQDHDLSAGENGTPGRFLSNLIGP